MSLKEKLGMIFITIIISFFSFIFIFDNNVTFAQEIPQELYKVYLDGNSIGVIKSKDKLIEHINKEQVELKEKYNVENVYLPQGLNVEKYVGFSKVVEDELELYKKIKDLKPFTIKGYTINIKKEDELTINVLDKEKFENSIKSTIKAFILEEDFQKFLNEETEIIGETGKTIEDLYIEENIVIQERYIPSNEEILIEESEITKVLLFGEVEESKEYIVKEGDTVDTIAFDNSLGVEEFLVVNPDIRTKNTILYVGQKVNIELISPIITIVKEENIIEDVEVKYETEIVYDYSKPYGYIFVEQEGKDGLERITQKILSKNNVIMSALISKKEVLEPTIKKRIVRGALNVDNIIVDNIGNWSWPTIKPSIITSPYGYRWGALHDGIDISGTGHGSPIFSVNNGVVYKTGSTTSYNGGWGGYVLIKHADNYYSMYAHLSKLHVTEGQTVTSGQIIGAMGNTGRSYGTHLHFSVYRNEPFRNSFNPLILYR